MKRAFLTLIGNNDLTIMIGENGIPYSKSLIALKSRYICLFSLGQDIDAHSVLDLKARATI